VPHQSIAPRRSCRTKGKAFMPQSRGGRGGEGVADQGRVAKLVSPSGYSLRQINYNKDMIIIPLRPWNDVDVEHHNKPQRAKVRATGGQWALQYKLWI